jgi:hypothetical protein
VKVGSINDHRGQYKIESIRAVLPIAPTTQFRHPAGTRTRRAAYRLPGLTTMSPAAFLVPAVTSAR